MHSDCGDLSFSLSLAISIPVVAASLTETVRVSYMHFCSTLLMYYV